MDWQEGDDTGSHTVYGDVFVPYLIDCVKQDRRSELSKAFGYIETMLRSGDAYAEEVMFFSVLESIAFTLSSKEGLCDMLGERSKEFLKEFL
ncbi:MAG TPA: hypothetical protein DEB24_02635 [Coriobacteriia bacterium]|nr:hypothetical protein [Coriobacteriia bacterium]